MHEAFARTRLQVTTLDLVWQWFHRVVAACSLLSGVLYWISLIGFHDGAQWRIDLMPVHWQVASVALAVLFPFAASGLWMLASWGPVIWFICAAIETGMYFGFPDPQGIRIETILAHGLVAVLYCMFRILFFLRARNQPD